jgi:hypothetical protein
MTTLEQLQYKNYGIDNEGSSGKCEHCGEVVPGRHLRRYEQGPILCIPCFLADYTNSPQHVIDEMAAWMNEN